MSVFRYVLKRERVSVTFLQIEADKRRVVV